MLMAKYERGYEVVFDVNVDGHSLEGRCQYGHDLWINPEYLQPLYLTKKHPNENIYKFKIKEEIKKLSKLQ